jgi:glycosyltransferase involved in cell wall biosynthesis
VELEAGHCAKLKQLVDTMPFQPAAVIPQHGNDERAASSCWHVITGEYPPQVGGVADYTSLVAAGLAAQGDEVHVWCPPQARTPAQPDGVSVHYELGAMRPRDLRAVGQQLDRFPEPRRILVQWVPHGFGYRSMNLPFCLWLWNRARLGDRVEIMAHEPFLPFHKKSLRQNGAALVHRLMTLVLLRKAERVWVSIPEWENQLRPYAIGRPIPFRWLPIPSTIPTADKPSRIRELRKRYAGEDGLLIGHFGTYGGSITSILEPVLVALAGDARSQTVLLMGQGSDRYREALVGRHPGLSGVVQAAGSLKAEDLSCHIAACDLLFQPYPDGVSSRRTSSMVALSHGKTVVTNLGALSERFWKETEALVLAPTADVQTLIRLLREVRYDQDRRARIGRAAQRLYQERFDITHTVEALRTTSHSPARSTCES